MSIINVDVFAELMETSAETRRRCKQVLGCFTAAVEALINTESKGVNDTDKAETMSQVRNHLKNASKFIIRLNDLCGKRLCNAFIRADDSRQAIEIYRELTQNAYESMKKRVLLNENGGDDE